MHTSRFDSFAVRAAVVAGIAVAVIAIIFVLPPFRNYQLATIAAYLCATAGLTVLIGRNGQLSLGHGALMACGAYSFALTSNAMGDAGVTGISVLLVPLVAAVLVTSVVGIVVGAAAARLHGPYLAGLTLALVVVIPSITTTFSSVLGGDQGLWAYVEGPPSSIAAAFTVEQWQATIAVVAAALTVLALSNLIAGDFGRRMQAVRDDPKVIAAYLGVEDEDRSAENEGGKENVELSNDPDRGPISRVRKLDRRGAGSLRKSRSSEQRQKRTQSQETAVPRLHDARRPP